VFITLEDEFGHIRLIAWPLLRLGDGVTVIGTRSRSFVVAVTMHVTAQETPMLADILRGILVVAVAFLVVTLLLLRRKIRNGSVGRSQTTT